jgi:hypothetical protein
VGDQSALIIARTRDSFTSFGFETIFTGVPIVCTGSTDFACTNPQLQNIGSSAWSLSGVNPACSGMVQDTFTNPREISGSWSVTCPASQMLTVTEATWTLTGID